jgi:hypothetical protein
MTDQEIKSKVNQVLKMMEDQFHRVEPSLRHPIHRDEYFEQHPEISAVQKRDFQFALSGEDIEKKNIPWLVAGCTGCSKLFSYYARKIGLNDFFVVLSVKNEHLVPYAKGQMKGQVHGHQVIAVKLSDGLHMIDVQHGLGKTFEQIEVRTKCKIDEPVDFEYHKGYTIAAILTPEEYDNTDSYEKIKAKYLSCDTAKRILLTNAKSKLINQQGKNIIANINKIQPGNEV